MVKTHRLLPLLSLALIGSTGTIAPYVFQIDRWSKETQQIYCLSDYHHETPDAITQRKELFETARKSNALIIVEDMAGYEGNHTGLKNYVYPYDVHKPPEQFLLHITTEAKQHDLDVCNVEFRQPTVGGIEHAPITAKQAFDLVELVEKEVHTYSDQEPFSTYYKTKLDEWNRTVGIPFKKWFSPISNSNELLCKAVKTLPYDSLIADILAPYNVGNLSQTAQKNLVFKLYNTTFLDVRIAHTLAQATSYDSIFLCAGSGHIGRINSLLQEAGYTYNASFVEKEGEEGVNLKEAFESLNTPTTVQEQHIPAQPTQAVPGWLIVLIGCISLILLVFGLGKRGSFRKVFARALLPLMIATIGSTTSAYVTQMQAWSNGTQTLYCLSDGHYPTALSINQTEQFIKRVCKEKEQSVVIIEDILEYDGPSQAVADELSTFYRPDLHFLPQLTKQCKEAGLNARGIEFRQDHCASRTGAPVTSQQVLQVSDQVRQQLKNYNNGPVFNRCYQRYIQEQDKLHELCGPFINQFRNSTQTLVNALPASTYSESLDAVINRYMGHLPTSTDYKKEKILKIYDAPLIDVRILHELAQHPDKKNIFICAGGWHIDNLAPSFEELGYTQLWSAKGNRLVEEGFPGAIEVGSAFNEFDSSLNTSCLPAQPKHKTPQTIPLALILLLITASLLLFFARKLGISATIVLCISSTTVPYVYQVDHWKNDDQQIHLYSDEHYPTPISKIQREPLITNVKNTNGVIIVEDMGTYDGNNAEVRKALQGYHDIDYHFLMKITQECRKNGITGINVEFRLPSNASLAGYNVSAKETLANSAAVKAEISMYDDGPVFNTVYKKGLEELTYFQHKYEPFFKQLRNKNQTLCSLLPNTKYYRSLDKALKESMEYVDSNTMIKKSDLITMYDAALIDFRILHALAQHRDAPHIYICAGGWHIYNLEQMFSTFGYEKINSEYGSVAITDFDGESLRDAVGVEQMFPPVKSTPTDTSAPHINMMVLLLIVCMVSLVLWVISRRRYALGALLLILFPLGAQAHIYKIEQWTDQDQTHNLFTLRDFHTSRFPTNHKGNEQRSAIVQLGKERRAQIIVEDIYPDAQALFNDPLNYNPNAIGPMTDKTPFKDSTTPLLALTPACSEHGVMFDNVEFRQLPYVSDMGHIITPADCIKSSDLITSEIEQYNDTPELNTFYAQQIKQYTTMRTQAQSLFDQLLAITDKTTKEVFEDNLVSYNPGVDAALRTFGWSDQRIASATPQDKVIKLFRFYSVPLVDAQMVHAVHKHRDNPNLIVCAGFKHIEAVEPMLKTIGYTKMGTKGKGLLEDGLPEPAALDIRQAFTTLDPHPILPPNNGVSPLVLILVALAVLLCLGLKIQVRTRQQA